MRILRFRPYSRPEVDGFRQAFRDLTDVNLSKLRLTTAGA